MRHENDIFRFWISFPIIQWLMNLNIYICLCYRMQMWIYCSWLRTSERWELKWTFVFHRIRKNSVFIIQTKSSSGHIINSVKENQLNFFFDTLTAEGRHIASSYTKWFTHFHLRNVIGSQIDANRKIVSKTPSTLALENVLIILLQSTIWNWLQSGNCCIIITFLVLFFSPKELVFILEFWCRYFSIQQQNFVFIETFVKQFRHYPWAMMMIILLEKW